MERVDVLRIEKGSFKANFINLSLFSTPLGILFQFDAPQVCSRIRQTQNLNKLALELG